MSSQETNVVPFFVLNLEEGKTKALFTVPSHLAESLIVHPVLCRGAAFELKLDHQSNEEQADEDYPQSTCFISTVFTSPHPEATAGAISERLASRVTDSCENPLSAVLGF